MAFRQPQTALNAVALVGPTASGKTRLALALAEHLPIEIISLDSALVYRDMDIGTAKPTVAERMQTPHHLIDIITPTESFSAAEFVASCQALCSQIHARHRIPVIVGGTMMYYHALKNGLSALPKADAALRAQLQEQARENGSGYLHAQLQKVDAATAARLAPSDAQRIERALEVFYATGKPLSAHFQAASCAPARTIFEISLMPQQRARLHEAIARRLDVMFKQGLVEEVAALRARYALTENLPSMRCVGYRQVWGYLERTISLSACQEQAVFATRQLAKRQLTWLRKLSPDEMIDPWRPPQVSELAARILRHQAQHA